MNEFTKLVMDNKMIDAKKVFEDAMQQKMQKVVSEKRKEVAQRLFNKKP